VGWHLAAKPVQPTEHLVITGILGGNHALGGQQCLLFYHSMIKLSTGHHFSKVGFPKILGFGTTDQRLKKIITQPYRLA